MTVQVHFNDGRVGEIDIPPGRSLMQAIAGQDRHAITALCGGYCICGTCRVSVLAGDPGPIRAEEAHLRRQLAIQDPAIRLSCQMRPGPNPGLCVAILLPR